MQVDIYQWNTLSGQKGATAPIFGLNTVAGIGQSALETATGLISNGDLPITSCTVADAFGRHLADDSRPDPIVDLLVTTVTVRPPAHRPFWYVRSQEQTSGTIDDTDTLTYAAVLKAYPALDDTEAAKCTRTITELIAKLDVKAAKTSSKPTYPVEVRIYAWKSGSNTVLAIPRLDAVMCHPGPLDALACRQLERSLQAYSSQCYYPATGETYRKAALRVAAIPTGKACWVDATITVDADGCPCGELVVDLGAWRPITDRERVALQEDPFTSMGGTPNADGTISWRCHEQRGVAIGNPNAVDEAIFGNRADLPAGYWWTPANYAKVNPYVLRSPSHWAYVEPKYCEMTLPKSAMTLRATIIQALADATGEVPFVTDAHGEQQLTNWLHPKLQPYLEDTFGAAADAVVEALYDQGYLHDT